jgi:hypothetical protein
MKKANKVDRFMEDILLTCNTMITMQQYIDKQKMTFYKVCKQCLLIFTNRIGSKANQQAIHMLLHLLF